MDGLSISRLGYFAICQQLLRCTWIIDDRLSRYRQTRAANTEENEIKVNSENKRIRETTALQNRHGTKKSITRAPPSPAGAAPIPNDDGCCNHLSLLLLSILGWKGYYSTYTLTSIVDSRRLMTCARCQNPSVRIDDDANCRLIFSSSCYYDFLFISRCTYCVVYPTVCLYTFYVCVTTMTYTRLGCIYLYRKSRYFCFLSKTEFIATFKHLISTHPSQ